MRRGRIAIVSALSLGVSVLAYVQNRMMVQALGAGELVDAFYLMTAIPMAIMAVFSITATNLITPEYAPPIATEPLDGVGRLLAAALALIIGPLLLQVPISVVLGLWQVPTGDAWTSAWVLLAGAGAYGISFALQPLLVARGRNNLFVVSAALNALVFILLLAVGEGRTLLSLSVVFLVAASVQAVACFVSLVATTKIDWSLKSRIPMRVRERARRGAAPVLLGVAFLQASAVVDRAFAERLGVGIVTTYYLADRIIQVFVSVVAMALGLALFAEFAGSDERENTRVLGRAVEAVVAVFAPMAAALWLCGEDVIRLLFGGSMFDEVAVARSGLSLRILALSLVSVMLFVVLPRRVQAAGRYAIHARIALSVLAGNVLAKLILVPRLGIAGLAASAVFAYTLATVAYLTVLTRLGMLAVDAAFLRRVGIPLGLGGIVVAISAVAAPGGAPWWMAPVVGAGLFGVAAVVSDGVEREIVLDLLKVMK